MVPGTIYLVETTRMMIMTKIGDLQSTSFVSMVNHSHHENMPI